MRKIKLTGGNVGRHRRKIGNTILVWCLTLGVVAILGVVGVKIFLHMGRESLKKNATSSGPVIVTEIPESAADEGESGAAVNNTPAPDTTWQENWVVYNGKVYEYNEEMLNFLVLGIDKMEKVKKSKDNVSGGQADAIFLVCMNQKTSEVKLIGVNRDTMVDVVMVGIGENGEDVIAPAEIAVQHGFGDGMEQSCELTVDAVSGLFYDLPIHGYMSFNMGGLAALSNALGGVTLTLQDDLTGIHKKWTKGTEITLKGQDTYDFLHWRDLKDFESARKRLARQKQYLSVMSHSVLTQTKEDITLPVRLYTKFKPYIVTNLSVDQISWLASRLVDYTIDTDTIYSLEGETKMGQQFEEFYPDKEALKALMFELFYDEVNLD